MVSRSTRALNRSKAEFPGRKQLTLAYLIILLERIVLVYAKPLIVFGAFVATAWFGVLNAIDPWLHLVIFVSFFSVFFHLVGKARSAWRPISFSAAKRRVEEASHLAHRPFDVLADRPAVADAEQLALWQAHREQANQKTQNLKYPRWLLSLGDKDPYALRYGLTATLVIALMFGWGALGSRVIAAMNPSLGKLTILNPTLNAWITPPEYTKLPPIMIATPAGLRRDSDIIDVPEGSTLTAHLAEKDGETPELVINGKTTSFEAADDNVHRDFNISQTITEGTRVSIKRGWQELASWRIHVVADKAPHISLKEAPTASERKTVRLNYTASDDYAVTEVTARVTSRQTMPGISNEPVVLSLSSPNAPQLERVNYADLTDHPWAGAPVTLQLIATDAAGHVSSSDPVDFILPERIFINPVAHALIEERKMLLQTPGDEARHNEAANIMAGIAHQPQNYRGDPVVMMALRSGAVRLVLNHDDNILEPIASLLWQSAVRIEDGTTGLAEQNLRKAQNDLAAALDRNAGEQEIQQLVGQLRQALSQYMAELSAHMATRPGPVDEVSQLLAESQNMMTSKDLEDMLQNIGNLSASGSRDAARQQLSQLQQMLENMRTEQPQLTEQQKQALRTMIALRDLTKQQQGLMDKTFQNANSEQKNSSQKLADEQKNLHKQLQDILTALKSEAPEDLQRGGQAMSRAGQDLQQGKDQSAVKSQNEAVQALQAALHAMADKMRSGMMMPSNGMQAMGEGQDPFGRNGFTRDDGGVKVPQQMEMKRVREILNELQRRSGDMNRPKTERDYIDRLLQNF